MSGESKTPRGRRAARLPEAAPGVTPAAELTLEEIEEQQLAEDARINSGDWNAIAPGKAQDFGRSFRRMIGLLAPWKWSTGRPASGPFFSIICGPAAGIARAHSLSREKSPTTEHTTRGAK